MVGSLKMWVWTIGQGEQGEVFIDKEIAEFQKICPVKVNIEVVPWHGYWNKILRIPQEQDGPDVIQIGSTWNATLAQKGILREITQETADLGGVGMFVPSSWPSCHFPASARISSLPWFVDIRPLYYRKDIFEAVGWLCPPQSIACRNCC